MSSRRPRIHHYRDALAVGGDGLHLTQQSVGGLLLPALGEARVKGLKHALHRSNRELRVIAVEQQRVALAHQPAHVAHPAQHRHAHRPGHDHHVRGERALFEHNALQPPPVVFEQLRRSQVLGDEDGIALEPGIGRRAELARNGPQEAVGQVFQVMHPIGKQRVGDLAHSHPGALLHALDGGFGGEAGINRLVNPARPALVVGEHLVGLEHLLVFPAGAELGLAGHRVDLLAHLVEGEVDARAFGLGILGHGVLDGDARLVEHRLADGEALNQLQPLEHHLPLVRLGQPVEHLAVHKPGIVEEFGEHHGDGLQRLDLDVLVAARLDVLHGQHADCPLAPHDGHAGEGVELLLPRLLSVLELRVRGCLVEVEGLDVARDGAGQPLPHAQPGDVDRLLVESAGGEEFEHSFAQQIDRAHLANRARCR